MERHIPKEFSEASTSQFPFRIIHDSFPLNEKGDDKCGPCYSACWLGTLSLFQVLAFEDHQPHRGHKFLVFDQPKTGGLTKDYFDQEEECSHLHKNDSESN